MEHAKQISCCFCWLLILGAASRAQDSPAPTPSPAAIVVEPVETYGDIPWRKEKGRLDSLALLLSQDPDLIGYIVVYAGRRACAGEAQARALRAKKYLVEVRGVAGDRIIWKDAGHLRGPHVILETQLRGGRHYPYTHPEPLPPKEVQVLNCRGLMSKSK